MVTFRSNCSFALLAAVATTGLAAAEPFRLHENIAGGSQYHVSVRVQISGGLQLPPDATHPTARSLAVSGDSLVEYDERIIDVVGRGPVTKTVRAYRQMDFNRKVGETPQHSTLRPEVRRMVLLRKGNLKVPFSPDGPLTWGEIDLVRTDVFTPALAGLLPDGLVNVSERWVAATPAVRELTDLERIEDGKIDCRLEDIVTLGGRRLARVSFKGVVRGVNEDGPSRQDLDGFLFFNLDANVLTYLSLKGVHTLLDRDGRDVGKVEGQFVLTRQHQESPGLSDAALRGVALEPTEANTLLLYENPVLGVRLLYPRRWHVAGARGRQVAIDEAGGKSGLLLTVEPLARVPSGAQFMAESRTYLGQQKARFLAQSRVAVVKSTLGSLETFTLDVDLAGKRMTMDYYVARQANGGATLVAHLAAGEPAGLRRDVAAIARSVRIVTPLSSPK